MRVWHFCASAFGRWLLSHVCRTSFHTKSGNVASVARCMQEDEAFQTSSVYSAVMRRLLLWREVVMDNILTAVPMMSTTRTI
mmetsp:Transcript_136766/g.248717  ORF Transcript_136766/g.248717 Transcript_136766/m.248717 type:complete len:82 (-) Transcript_136766:294-539(-)